MSAEYYLVGRIRRAHGIRGELVIEPLTDEPDAIFASGRRVLAGTREGDLAPDRRELIVRHASPFKNGLIVAFEGIEDRTAAESWRERTVLLPEEEVSPPTDDEIFIHDLVGMAVVHVSGSRVGTVREVFELKQGLLMDVERADGRSVLLPFDDHTVADMDTETRTIRVDPVEGLLD